MPLLVLWAGGGLSLMVTVMVAAGRARLEAMRARLARRVRGREGGRQQRPHGGGRQPWR